MFFNFFYFFSLFISFSSSSSSSSSFSFNNSSLNSSRRKLTLDLTKEWDFRSKYSSEYIIWGERSNEMYGSSIAIWDNYMIVGAYGDTSKEIDTGAVYVYEKHDINNEHDNWKQSTILHPDDGLSGDQFGYAVALDSYIALVGAPKHDVTGENSGAVYLYQRQYGQQHQQQQQQQQQQPKHRLLGGGGGAGGQQLHSQLIYSMKLTHPDIGIYTHFYYFGSSVAVHINTSVIGAWNCLSDDFIVTGCAFVWRRIQQKVYQGEHGEWYWDSKWEYFQRLLPSESQLNMKFGFSVSVYDNKIAIGAPGSKTKDSDSIIGNVYIFESHSAIADNYLGWEQTSKLKPSDGHNLDEFGTSVCLWNNNLLVGSPHHDISNNEHGEVWEAGSVYSFYYSKWGEWDTIEKIYPKKPVIQGHFGHSIDIYGNIAAIGAYNSYKDGSGTVYIYREDKTETGEYNWKYITHRQPEKEIPGDMYGYSVSVYYSTIAVGAFGASLAWENPSSAHNKGIYMNGGVYIYTGHYEPEEGAIVSYLIQNILFTLTIFVIMSSIITASIFFILNKFGFISSSSSSPSSSSKSKKFEKNIIGIKQQTNESFGNITGDSSHGLINSDSSTHSINDMDISTYSNFCNSNSNNNTNYNLEEGNQKSKFHVLEIHQ